MSLKGSNMLRIKDSDRTRPLAYCLAFRLSGLECLLNSGKNPCENSLWPDKNRPFIVKVKLRH